MEITEKNIFIEAKKGNVEVLNHKSVDQFKNDRGRTPLHFLAESGILAESGKIEVLNHPSVDQVKDNFGETPLHYLADQGKVTKKILKEKYPWFKCEGREINEELITEILNTPSSIKFILE